MTTTLLWWLLALQIAMGAFDTIYHHELTERLAWRPSQRAELRLHAVRNLLYAALFLVLGFAEPRGWLALLVTAILLVEVGITLADFVEEDLSRRLPATERINHTLLALNYGGILVLLLPILWEWSGEPTGLMLVSHGASSLLALGAACGVAILGVRDWRAAARSERLAPAPARGLASALPPARRILITGGTGFVGSRLVAALVADGHTVSVLTRDRAHAAHLPAPITVLTALDQVADDERFDAIVNLAGAPIGDAPWTARKRRCMPRSRLRTTRGLVRLLNRLACPPRSSSAARRSAGMGCAAATWRSPRPTGRRPASAIASARPGSARRCGPRRWDSASSPCEPASSSASRAAFWRRC